MIGGDGCWFAGVLVYLRVRVVSEAVQSVPAPHAIPALKQLLRRNVDLAKNYISGYFCSFYLFVNPAVVLVDCHVVALLTGDGVVLLDLMAPRPTVEVHLPGVVAGVGAVVTNLHPLLASVSGDKMSGHFCCIVTFKLTLFAF